MTPKSIDYYWEDVSLEADGLSKEQQESRQKFLLFLDGDCPQEIKDFIVNRISEISKDNRTIWVIGFIPAPDDASTIIRYGDLALVLGERTDCEVFLDLFYKVDSGKKNDDYRVEKNRVSGKGVILIDALISSGSRYRHFSYLLKQSGAKSIHGIIIGKSK